VVHTVNFARQRNLPVAVRGGGHCVAGLSTCERGVVIDLTRMRAVTVDPTARRASVQGGAVWG
jgi:FAD/FMN-containing dehydrogenase